MKWIALRTHRPRADPGAGGELEILGDSSIEMKSEQWILRFGRRSASPSL